LKENLEKNKDFLHRAVNKQIHFELFQSFEGNRQQTSRVLVKNRKKQVQIWLYIVF